MSLRAPVMISIREWRRAEASRGSDLSHSRQKRSGLVGDQQFLDDASGAAECAGFGASLAPVVISMQRDRWGRVDAAAASPQQQPFAYASAASGKISVRLAMR